jgi:hypothetical protein
MERCSQHEPLLTDIEGRRVACHLYDRDVYRAPIKLGAAV